MEQKQYKTFSVGGSKAIDDQGLVEHLVAVFGNIDDGGDIIHPGAFRKTIIERQGKIRCLDQHATDSIMRVIGYPVSMREITADELPQAVKDAYPEATGALSVQTQYLMDTPEGRGAFARVKSGAVSEYSIGYDALDSDFGRVTKDGEEITVRNLRQIRLWEYSPVIFAMNPATATLSAKAADNPADKVPTEGKPWAVFEEGGKFAVYKVDENGDPIGDPVGIHDSEEDARAQVAALYAAENGKAQEPMAEQKVGRIFAARNINRLRELSKILAELLEEIGEPEEDADDNITLGKAKNPQAAEQAGPGTCPPTTEEKAPDMLHLIEIELAEI